MFYCFNLLVKSWNVLLNYYLEIFIFRNRLNFFKMLQENGNFEMESYRRENNIVSFDNVQCFMDKKVVLGYDFDIEIGILQ